MELLLLPHDSLLAVMQFLDVPDLLTCRLVSKRMGELALDPDVWRDRCLLDPDQMRWACPVLRLAPCLYAFKAVLHGIDVPTQACQHALLTTRCAVKYLQLDVSQTRIMLAAAVIRNQVALGRLTDLDIKFLLTPNDPADYALVSWLMTTVVLASGLERLVLYDTPPCAPNTKANLDRHSGHCTPHKSTVRHLTCDDPSSAYFFNLVLSSQAATLESVHLTTFSRPISAFDESTALLLAALPNLRNLNCPLLPGLEAVAACPRLEEVTLYVFPDHPNLYRVGAIKFLRRASQLRKVHLSSCGLEISANFLAALAASGRSNVEVLEISSPILDLESVLLKALPSLPALRVLEVQKVTDELLLCITPALAPRLQILVVTNWGKIADRPCGHAWLHVDAVKAVHRANPSLQVFVNNTASLYCPNDFRCKVCALDCHRGRVRVETRMTSMYPQLLLPREAF